MASSEMAGRILKGSCLAGVGLIGLALVATALTRSEGGSSRTAMALFGVILLLVAIGTAGVWFPRARRPETYVASDGTTVTLSLRSRRQVPAVLVLVLVAVLLGIATVAVDSSGRWIFAALALFLLLPVPDMIRGIVRQPALRIDVAGLQLRGPAFDAEIAWTDVLDVGLTNINAQTPVVRVRGRDGAASHSHTKRGLLFGKQPARPDLDVPTILVDDPYGIYVILNGLAMARADERPGMVAEIPGLLEDRANGIRPENEGSC